MVVRRRKKVTKYRAQTTHGGGSRKKRRGAGSRGGRGNAGTGKKASHKPRTIGESKGLSKKTDRPKAINVGSFTLQKLAQLVKSEKVKKEGDVYTIDLAQLGYQKLLGTGSVTLKLRVNATLITKRAQEKIEAAGGEIVTA